jgi:hypothetical protein
MSHYARAEWVSLVPPLQPVKDCHPALSLSAKVGAFGSTILMFTALK